MRLEPVIFAEIPRGARRVEITQRNELQTMNLIVPAQDFFKGELRFAVRIDRACRRSFVDWQPLGHPENRAGRGKNDSLYSRCHHGIQQVQAVGNVVAKIFGWIAH